MSISNILKGFRKKHKRKSISEIIVYFVVFCVCLFFGASFLYCVLWCAMAGLKTHNEVILKPFDFPAVWNFANYFEVLSGMKVNKSNFIQMFLNSTYFSVIGGLLNTFVVCTFAYVTTKYKFFGSKAIFWLVMFRIIFPIYGSGGTAYRLYHSLGWTNSYAMIFGSICGMSLYYLYFTSFYASMSDTYREAAKMDGAGDFVTFFRLVLPMSIPMFGAVFLMQWMTDWNNYGTALLYLPKIPTLAVGTYLYQTVAQREFHYDYLYAACFLSSIPTIVLYSIFNGVITKNVSIGGIKE